jgi:hypothetical protein
MSDWELKAAGKIAEGAVGEAEHVAKELETRLRGVLADTKFGAYLSHLGTAQFGTEVHTADSGTVTVDPAHQLAADLAKVFSNPVYGSFLEQLAGHLPGMVASTLGLTPAFSADTTPAPATPAEAPAQ